MAPLISTQQTVVENDFNAKQRPERLHLTVGNLEYDVIPSKPVSKPGVTLRFVMILHCFTQNWSAKQNML
jgi:hypothetical protein